MDGLMDELVTFLHARLDDDEQTARGALERWPGSEIGQLGIPAAATHIARHDPARVIRDIDAKRQILRHITPELDAGSGGVDSDEFGDELAHWTRLLTIARLFAQAYADHPNYQEDWRP